MDQVSKLQPTKRERVMDLIKVAGVDVTDWKNFKGGVSRAASNPKYCYSWSFVQPEKVVVLNLWYRDCKMRADRIVQKLDVRREAREYARLGKREWQRRALQMDQAVQIALRSKLPIRVVICDGDMHNLARDQKASRVKKRMLDDSTWSISRYDWRTGRCEITRGSIDDGAVIDVECSTLIPEEIHEAEFEEGGFKRIAVNAYERNAQARKACLNYWGASCTVCGLNFEKTYGEGFRGLIHVHHLTPVSSKHMRYKLNPKRDLRPVCPNCHAALHYRKSPPYTIDEMKDLLRELPQQSSSLGVTQQKK